MNRHIFLCIRDAIAHFHERCMTVPVVGHLLLSRYFYHELNATLHGLREHHRHAGNPVSATYRLRRNIHRLEKGLIMRPFRSVFGTAYLDEIIDDLQTLHRASENTGTPIPGCSWYLEVLTRYFRHTASDTVIDRNRARFEKCRADLNTVEAEGLARTRLRRDSEPCRVSYDQLVNLAMLRRSVRWYQQRPVPRELLDQAVSVASLSPSACNRQPFRFLVFDEPERVARVARIPTGTSGFCEQFPVIIVVVGHLEAFAAPRDRHLIYIDASLAAMSFMLALETLGLSSCPINWPAITGPERQLRKELALKPHEQAVMMISVGYADPDGGVPSSGKTEIGQLRSYNP